MLKYALALAMIAVPQAVSAQAAPPADGPVSVEILSSGKVVVPASRYRFSVTLTGKGADEKAAEAALAANRGKLIQALSAQGIQEGKPIEGGANSLTGLFSAFAGRGKTSFALDMADEDEKPQSTATETLYFDARTRASALAAKPAIEANNGKMADEVVALLDDYVAPTRQAKADAIAKARSEAAAYAATLGLRRAAVTRISERQDIVAGSMGFFYQLINMFAPKPESAGDGVTVSVNLSVEFQLSR